MASELPTSNQKLYAERDHYQLSPQYERHLLAMTAEGLYSKSAIAAELAYRDIEIERLRPMAESWESYEAAQERKAEMQPVETSSDVSALLTVQQHNKRLRAALSAIAVGTPDLLPPFRIMGEAQLRAMARKALGEVPPVEPTAPITVAILHATTGMVQIGPERSPEKATAVTWTCPSCSMRGRPADAYVCTNCGEKRPENGSGDDNA